MKKIICLLVAIAAMLALVSCGECETHIDADKDGVCDECGAAVEIPAPECTDHVDADGDGVCDTEGCNEAVEPAPVEPANKAFFDAIAAAEPTVITTMSSISVDNTPYVTIYRTTITEDGFIHDVTSEREATFEDDSDEAKITEWTRIVYAGGIYTKYVKHSESEEFTDGVALSMPPVIEYVNVKNNITVENITDYTMSRDGATLTAELTPELCETVFGAEVSADTVKLTVKTIGGRLSAIEVQYTAANGAVVNVTTSYSYAPVNTGAAE